MRRERVRHSSIQLNEPMELIYTEEISPLISRVQIKVCYVDDKPNRNGTVITKELARNKLAPSLRGSPIVGFYNEEKGDFEEHNEIIQIKNGEWSLKEETKPYGFVDLNARLWFQKFLDDGRQERTYLMTEGYLWTEQYPEAKRVLSKGNNQSMALDANSVRGQWSENDEPSFFIINDAVIKNLCILGEDVEPCFEGSDIKEPTIQFSFNPDFQNKMFSMIAELKELISKGGEQVDKNTLGNDIEIIDVDSQGVNEPVLENVAEVAEPEVQEPEVAPAAEPAPEVQ